MPWISIILTKNIVLGHSLIKSVGDNIFCNECGTENPDVGKFVEGEIISGKDND